MWVRIACSDSDGSISNNRGPDKVRRELQAIIQRTGANELIVAGAIHDHAARLRSYEIVARLSTG